MHASQNSDQRGHLNENMQFRIIPTLNEVVVNWFDVPMAAFEVVTGFWLVFKGLRLQATEDEEAQRRR